MPVADVPFQFRETLSHGGVTLKAIFEADGDEFVHPGERLLTALGGDVAAGFEMGVMVDSRKRV